MMTRPILMASALALAWASQPVSPARAAEMDFSNLPHGYVVDMLSKGHGISGNYSGSVAVDGRSTSFPNSNPTTVFDSSCPPPCRFEDQDISTPHSDFGGPGRGGGGAAGSPFQNDTFLGNLVILPRHHIGAEVDGIVDDPTGSDDPGFMDFTFLKNNGSPKAVTINSVTVMDVEVAENETPAVIVFSGPGIPPASISFFDMGDGGVATIDGIDLDGVTNMRVNFKGSAAFVGALFEERAPGTCWITTGGFHNSGGTSGSKEYTFGGNVGPPPSGSWQVTEHDAGNVRLFHTNDVHITDCIEITGTGPGQPGGKKGFVINQAFFEGVGRLNGVPGFPFSGWVVDRGEPSGKNGNDTDEFYIKVDVSGTSADPFETQILLDGGNVQIHPPTGSTK